jgi:hypothetical protein
LSPGHRDIRDLSQESLQEEEQFVTRPQRHQGFVPGELAGRGTVCHQATETSGICPRRACRERSSLSPGHRDIIIIII